MRFGACFGKRVYWNWRGERKLDENKKVTLAFKLPNGLLCQILGIWFRFERTDFMGTKDESAPSNLSAAVRQIFFLQIGSYCFYGRKKQLAVILSHIYRIALNHLQTKIVIGGKWRVSTGFDSSLLEHLDFWCAGADFTDISGQIFVQKPKSNIGPNQ